MGGREKSGAIWTATQGNGLMDEGGRSSHRGSDEDVREVIEVWHDNVWHEDICVVWTLGLNEVLSIRWRRSGFRGFRGQRRHIWDREEISSVRDGNEVCLFLASVSKDQLLRVFFTRHVLVSRPGRNKLVRFFLFVRARDSSSRGERQRADRAHVVEGEADGAEERPRPMRCGRTSRNSVVGHGGTGTRKGEIRSRGWRSRKGAKRRRLTGTLGVAGKPAAATANRVPAVGNQMVRSQAPVAATNGRIEGWRGGAGTRGGCL